MFVRRFLAMGMLSLPFAAAAHVKWFVDYNMEHRPAALLHLVQSGDFMALVMLATGVIFFTSILDRKLPSPVDVSAWQPALIKLERFAPGVLRYGTAFFFLTLTLGFPHIILTPELVIPNPAMRYVHAIIAVMALHRRTSLIAGAGILFLYSYATQLYGTFHMLDYLVFIGVGVHLISQTLCGNRVRGLPMEVVRFTLAYSFLWGAIEKFMQPALFHQLLKDYPYLTMGLNSDFFIRASGFVEFCCAWHIFSGRAAGYAGIGLMAFFVIGAVIPFGMIDFIGHFLFIVPLTAILLVPRRVPLCRTAWGSTLAFVTTLALFLLAAYAAWYMLYFYLHPHLFRA